MKTHLCSVLSRGFLISQGPVNEDNVTLSLYFNLTPVQEIRPTGNTCIGHLSVSVLKRGKVYFGSALEASAQGCLSITAGAQSTEAAFSRGKKRPSKGILQTTENSSEV